MCQLASVRTTLLHSYISSPLCCILYSIPCILTNYLIREGRRRDSHR